MASPISVVHVLASLRLGGTESRVVDYLKTADRTGFRHSLCCVTRGGDLEEKVRRLDIPLFIARRRFRADVSVIGQLARFMKEQRADIVHTRNFTANLWGRLAAKMAGVGTVISGEHGTGWETAGFSRVLNRLLDRDTQIIAANSEAARHVAVKWLGATPEQTRVIYSGIDCSAEPATPEIRKKARSAIGVNSVTPLISAVGRLIPAKGFQYLIRAMPTVWESAPDATLLIAGDGPYGDALSSMIPSDAGKRIILLGSRSDIHDLLAAADVFVMPTLKDAIPGALIEAALSGLPCVATEVDGVPEVLDQGRTGVIVRADQVLRDLDGTPLPRFVVNPATGSFADLRAPSPDALAHAIIGLLAAPERREQLGTAARAFAADRFDLSRCARKLEDLYLESAGAAAHA